MLFWTQRQTINGQLSHSTVVTALDNVEAVELFSTDLLIQGWNMGIHKTWIGAANSIADLSHHVPSKHDFSSYSHLKGIYIPVNQRQKVYIVVSAGEVALTFRHNNVGEMKISLA